MQKWLSAIILTVLMLATPAFAKNPLVEVNTSDGSFELELYPEKAPKTVKNFLQYVEDGTYVGTQFHRVIKGFMVQGGGFDKNMMQIPTNDPIKNESKPTVKNLKGTIAMARTSNPDSATRQFFINLVNNHFLNATNKQVGYAVFGKVTKGFSVIEKIGNSKTGYKNGMQDVPEKPIVINSMKIIK